MTRCTSIAPLGSRFDSFLFAPIGEDRNGMLLSVVSALARLNVDPWEEAGELASLPREAAISRLASLIAPLPDGPSTERDPGTIAGRLIALLPRQDASGVPPNAALRGAGEEMTSRVVSYALYIFMALMVGAQLFAAGRLAQAPGDAPAPPSSTVAPNIPDPSSAQGRASARTQGIINAPTETERSD